MIVLTYSFGLVVYLESAPGNFVGVFETTRIYFNSLVTFLGVGECGGAWPLDFI